MTKQLIVVSAPGQRLVVEVGNASITTMVAAADDYTHLVVEAAPHPQGGMKDATPPPPAEGKEKGEYPAPPLDIKMSLVAGLPDGVEAWDLGPAKKFHGKITFADLVKEVGDSGGELRIVMLEPDNGG
jgi:hypothetical protein